MHRPLRCAAALLALAGPSLAQGVTLEDVRDELRESLRDRQVLASLAGVIVLSDELELSGAGYEIGSDGEVRLRAISFPFQTTLRPWAEGSPGLHVEGVLGYAREKESAQDVWGGALPGFETKITERTTTYGALFGVGPEVELAPGLALATLAQLGLARLENRADYSGPGAGFTRALLDGLLLNWDALALSYGGAARLDWSRPLSGDRGFEALARYDLRWTRTFEADDPAQEFSSRAQLVTLRADLDGPTDLRLWDEPVRWGLFAGYRRFLEGDLFEVRDFVQLGGSLELGVGEHLPVVSGLELTGAVVFGHRIRGWTIGLGGSF